MMGNEQLYACKDDMHNESGNNWRWSCYWYGKLHRVLGLAGHLMHHNLQHDSGRLDFLFEYKSENDLIENVASVQA